jgi:two-component system response regulator YesN
MYKVMLADDENRILKFMQTSIPWSQLGLEVSATATDGETALQLVIENNIDIVITDIRMPKLDGLELCKRLHDIKPDIQIIIVSGFADFAYAQKAIQLQVLGYCLKPIDASELTKLVCTAVRNIHKETTFNGDNLLDCIEEGQDQQIRLLFHNFGMNAEKYYVASSIKVHNIENYLKAELTLKIGKHKYLYFSVHPFDQKATHELICYSKEKGGIGIYPSPVLPSQLKDAITISIIMAYQYFFTNTPTLCEKLVEGQLTDDLFLQLKKSLQSSKDLKLFLKKLQKANYTMLFNIKTAYRFYNYIYSSKVMGTVLDSEEFFINGYEQLTTEYNCFDEILTEILDKLNTPIVEVPLVTPSASSFIQIMKYLNENYEKDVSLKKLSEHFHMNSSYISYLIKNETGLTYSQHLTELRIEKAKKLLTTTDLSLTEISEAIGFNDYFYFIKKFKKVVGVTPGSFINK